MPARKRQARGQTARSTVSPVGALHGALCLRNEMPRLGSTRPNRWALRSKQIGVRTFPPELRQANIPFLGRGLRLLFLFFLLFLALFLVFAAAAVAEHFD